MRFDMQLMGPVVLALLTALVVSFLMTPVVKSFAYKVGAIDVPKDARRMHHKPIPRLGGLAIFAGFMVSILLFVDIRLNPQMQSILLGAVIIVVLGVVDDIMALPAKLKFPFRHFPIPTFFPAMPIGCWTGCLSPLRCFGS